MPRRKEPAPTPCLSDPLVTAPEALELWPKGFAGELRPVPEQVRVEVAPRDLAREPGHARAIVARRASGAIGHHFAVSLAAG